MSDTQRIYTAFQVRCQLYRSIIDPMRVTMLQLHII
jgi:hypothetical protein